jgi:hypothetical protein
MYLVRIDQEVSDYDRWKAVFDADPLGRQQSGVLRHRIARADDGRHVAIDLELDARERADAMVASLHRLWGRVEGDVIEKGARAQVYEVVETAED